MIKTSVGHLKPHVRSKAEQIAGLRQKVQKEAVIPLPRGCTTAVEKCTLNLGGG